MSNYDPNLPESPKPAEEKVVPVLKDLLSALDIITSNRYMTLASQNEIDVYVTYITYRVQQDLYQLCRECGLLRDLTWEDFVLLMRQHKPARTAAMVVVRETLKEFFHSGQYDFDAAEVKLIQDSDVEDGEDIILHCSNLFPKGEGSSLIEGILFHAEVSHYKRLRNQGKDFPWQEYLDELEQKGPMWAQVYTAFRDALVRLDFKPVWSSEKLEELVRQTGGSEV